MAGKRPIEHVEEQRAEEDASPENESEAGFVESEAGFVSYDGDSDSEKSFPSPNVSDFTIRPIAPKPENSLPNLDQVAGNSTTKKVKNPSSAHGDEKIQRLFSEEDEIVLLKGMIEYKAKKGVDPLDESVEFHESVKNSLHVDLTKKQLIDKIRKLRWRYRNKSAVFSKPHDQTCRNLMRKIWPSERSGVGKSRKKARHDTGGESLKVQMNGGCNMDKIEASDGEEKKKVEANGQEDEEEVIFDDYPCLMGSLERGKPWALPDYWKGFLLERIGQIGKEKLNEMEGEWRSLQQAELRLIIRRIELVQEQAKLALDMLKGTED